MTAQQAPLPSAAHHNQQLFADHYLNAILPRDDDWQALATEAAPIKAQIAAFFAAFTHGGTLNSIGLGCGGPRAARRIARRPSGSSGGCVRFQTRLFWLVYSGCSAMAVTSLCMAYYHRHLSGLPHLVTPAPATAVQGCTTPISGRRRPTSMARG